MSASGRKIDEILYGDILVRENDLYDLLGNHLYRSHFWKNLSETKIKDIRAESLPKACIKIESVKSVENFLHEKDLILRNSKFQLWIAVLSFCSITPCYYYKSPTTTELHLHFISDIIRKR